MGIFIYWKNFRILKYMYPNIFYANLQAAFAHSIYMNDPKNMGCYDILDMSCPKAEVMLTLFN